MRKVFKWFAASNRWKHLAGGACVGVLAPSGMVGAVYCSAVVAGALEFKDKAHGGSWDWVDFVLTIVGGASGGFLRLWTGL